MKQLKLSFPIAILIFLTNTLNSQQLIKIGDEWKYFRGNSNPDKNATSWYSSKYDDSDWDLGASPFWYGDGVDGTEITDMRYNYSTFYIRNKFEVSSLNNLDGIKLLVNYDDGFRIWMNGIIIYEQNAPLNPTFESLAPDNHESGSFELFLVDSANSHISTGTNLIAIQGYNVDLSSSDFHLGVSLEVLYNLPKADPPIIETKGGFFYDPINVIISSLLIGDTIKYTLDGSNPQFSTTSVIAATPVSITIDPDNIERPNTPGVLLRACAIKNGLNPSYVVASTYIYINKVKNQTYPGGDWPESSINNQIIDYEMDPDIVDDSRYTDQIEAALLDIPSISIVTDLENLFDPETGIYVNANYHGYTWERPVSVELINPDNSEGFNNNAGIRIRGGWSRHPDNPKHAFRLFFREEYGTPKLQYPLFEDEGVSEFDKIDLRTSQNYFWSYGNDSRNTMNRDVFSRDLQKETGQPYTRSRYYHLYLNGMYWGLFQSQERPEARFAESYLGGTKEEYDVVKVNIGDNWEGYDLEATDGNMGKWREVWNILQDGFSHDKNYYRLEGKNENGEIDSNLEVLVDIDNLIDYMLIIFYGGNFDSPVSKFGSNQGPNNFYCIKNRERDREGFKFFIHDAEHTLLAYAASPGIGVNENRVNIGNIDGDYKMLVSNFDRFHPQWLHYKLTDNKKYRLRFADRAYKYLYNDGILTTNYCKNIFQSSASQIENAIIAESARWGDSRWRTNRTKDDDWIPEINTILNSFIGKRTNILISQLKDEGLLPQLTSPSFIKNGKDIGVSIMNYSSTYTLTIQNPNTTGTIYYTLNGEDPRDLDGEINDGAKNIDDNNSINISYSIQIKARVKNNSEWSALRELTVIKNDNNFSNIKITEINYFPMDYGNISGRDLEFIEFKNIGENAINITELKIDTAIYYVFPKNTLIHPDKFIVLASNKYEFEKFYKLKPFDEYSGHLGNTGEDIIILDKNENLSFSCFYQAQLPWPIAACGSGYTLVSKELNPTGDPNNVDYWRSSLFINGSPNADDIITDIKIYSYIENPDNFLVYPNPTNGILNIYNQLNHSMQLIELKDLKGKVIFSFNSNSPMISVDFNSYNIPGGFYILTIIDQNQIVNKKILYQKIF